MVVDPGERLVGVGTVGDAAIAVQAEAASEIEYLAAQERQTARVDSRGLVILVDQTLQFRQRTVAFGAGHGRGEVVDDDRRGAAFGLAPFAGVVDDEGVEMRQRPERGFGETFFRQGDRLARQPFQVAVLAEMDDGVGVESLAQPGVEREIAMRRNEVRVMIGGGGVDVVAARRLHAEDDIAESRDGESESAVGDARIGLGGAPAAGHRGANRLRQAGERPFVGRDRIADGAARGDRPTHERAAVGGDVAHLVAGGGEGAQGLQHAGGGVESDAVADAPVARRIIGEHDGDPAPARRGAAQACPGGREGGDELHAVGHGFGGDDRTLRARVPRGFGLERDGAREQAPVDLRQGHVHGDVARGQALGAGAPRRFRRAGEYGLQHRRARAVEGRGTARLPRPRDGEARGVEDYVRRRIGEERFQSPGRHGVAQARDVDRQGVEAAPLQRCAERVDRREMAGLKERAIEHQGDEGPGGVAALLAAAPDAGPGHGRGFEPGRRLADQMRRVAQKITKIGAAAMHAIAPQALPCGGGKGAQRGEFGVRPVVAGKDRQGDAAVAAAAGDALDPVGPVGGSAEQAHDDEARAGDHGVDMEVDRKIVSEPQQVGETQAGAAFLRMGRRERGEFGVGGAEHDDIAGRLPEIDGLGSVADGSRRGREQVHPGRRPALRRCGDGAGFHDLAVAVARRGGEGQEVLRDRVRRRQVRGVLAGHGAGPHGGANGAGVQQVHAYRGLAHLLGIDAREGLQAGLGGGVGAPIGAGATRHAGGDEDDAAGVGAAQQRIESAQEAPIPAEADVDDALPVVRADVADGRQGAEKRRVPDEDVEPSVAFGDGAAQTVDSASVGQVEGRHRRRSAGRADALRQRLQRRASAGHGVDMGARGGERLGDRGADAARGPGDQGDTAVENPGGAPRPGAHGGSARRESCAGAPPAARSPRGMG